MSNSRHINYSIRPAKGAERKMIVDLSRRLSCFHPLSDYQYVGYGGAYFCDFSLFHKALNISSMISIEKDSVRRKRYDFNKPFHCINMKFGQARDILPNLNWAVPSIVWMDETSCLTEDLLNVVCGVVREIVSGSLVILTVSEMSLCDKDGTPGRDGLLKHLGKFTPDIKDGDLGGLRLHSALFNVFCVTVQSTLARLNEGRETLDHRSFVPVLSISYQDGKRMATYGGIVLSKKDESKWSMAEMRDLPFYFDTGKQLPYEIEVPNLSVKEVQRLNESLPTGDLALCESETGLATQDIQAYKDIYRYYMNLSEVIG